MTLIILLLFLYLWLGVNKRRKHGLRLNRTLYLDGDSLILIASFTFPFFFLFISCLFGRGLTPQVASPSQIDHKLLYLLRRPDDLCAGLSLMHLPDHNLEFDDPTLIDLAEKINLGGVVSFEGGNGSSVLDLNDVVIGEEVVAGERAVNEVHPI